MTVLTGKSNNAISLQAETAGGVAGAPVEVELKLWQHQPEPGTLVRSTSGPERQAL